MNKNFGRPRRDGPRKIMDGLSRPRRRIGWAKLGFSPEIIAKGSERSGRVRLIRVARKPGMLMREYVDLSKTEVDMLFARRGNIYRRKHRKDNLG